MTMANRAVLVTGANRGITQVSAPKAGLNFLFSLSKSPHPARHPYRGGLTVKLATEEVNDVPILFGNRGSSRRRGGFYRRSSSIGCESFSQKERSRRNRSQSE